MKGIIKLGIFTLAAMPMLASAQDSLHIYAQADHFDIDGITGGGPFTGDFLTGSTIIDKGVTLYCDSVSQEFSIGQTFAVQLQSLDSTTNTSLDPWVIVNATHVASLFDSLHKVSLSDKEITSAGQGVIWNLDGQISGSIYSNQDSNTGLFANFLLNQATSIGDTNVSGFVRYSCDANYANGQTGVLGQSQIGMAPVPEPSSLLALGLPVAGLAFRKRRTSK